MLRLSISLNKTSIWFSKNLIIKKKEKLQVYALAMLNLKTTVDRD